MQTDESLGMATANSPPERDVGLGLTWLNSSLAQDNRRGSDESTDTDDASWCGLQP
jgi:hypothetical protein